MIEAFSHWLAATALSQSLARVEWVVPLVQTLHILAVAGLLISLAFINLRVVRGALADGPTLAARFTPQIRAGAWALLATGLLLTLIEPARELLNAAFRIKVLLLIPLLWLTARAILAKLRAAQAPSTAIALANLVLLLAIVTAGRFIAYI